MLETSIAFLGTGLMGAPMAGHLCAAGYPVTVWNRTPSKAEPLVAAGARMAASPADAVPRASVVILMVSDGAAASELLFEQGVADTLGEGGILIDMSSITPAEARDHAARLASRGIAHLDAPVSGGTKGAEEARLAIMVGGEEAAFARAEPILKVMGRAVRVGPPGSGQLAKLANQAIVGATIGIVAEATLLVESGGGDVAAFRDALKGGFADSTILQLHGKRMSDNDFRPGARSAIQLKDMKNILAEADHLGIKLPMSAAIRARYETLVGEMDGGDLDHAALYLELKERAQRG